MSIDIRNVQNYDYNAITVKIPPFTPLYTQTFTNSLELDPKKNHYINEVEISYPQSGFYNIETAERLSIGYFATGTTTFYNIDFTPGFYRAKDIEALINGSSPPSRPFVLLDQHRFIINGSKSVFNVSLDFTNARTLQTIMGFYDVSSSTTVGFSTRSTKPDSTKKKAYKSPLFPAFDVYNAFVKFKPPIGESFYKSFYIGCDLVNQSSLITQNFIANMVNNVDLVNVPSFRNNLYTFSTRYGCLIPLNKFNISSINWRVVNIDNLPFTTGESIVVTIKILSK